jgi:GT2 family glycosyltransferase
MFDSRLLSGGDIELGVRMRQAGIKIGYAENSVVCHYHRTTVRGLIEQYKRYGFNEGMVIAKHSLQLNRRIWLSNFVPRQMLSLALGIYGSLTGRHKQGLTDCLVQGIMAFCHIWGRFSAGVRSRVLIL